MDLSLIVARLKAQLVDLKSIGLSGDLDAAIEGTVATPVAFVLPLAESATAMDTLGRTGSQETHKFGVVHCVTNRRDGLGGAALQDLAVLRLKLKTSLVGWVPDTTNGEPVHFAGGRLLRLDGNSRLWWIDEFELISYFWSN